MRLSPRAKRRLRRAGYVASAVVAYCLAHVLLVAVYPNPLFRYRMTYREFTIHMRQPVPPEMTAVLDRVHSLLDEGEVFLSRMGVRIGQLPTGRADTTPAP